MSRELDEFLRRQEQAPQAAAQARINAGRQQQPAQAAEIAQASRGLGVPPEVVSAAPDTYKQQASSVSDNLALGRSSRLAGWLAQNETNAPIARGAFSGLADMQSHIGKTGATKAKNTPDRTREALAGLGVGGGMGYEVFNFVKNTISAVTSGDVNTSKVGSALASGAAGAATGIAGFGEAAFRTMDKYSPIAIAERSLFGQSLEGMAADRAQSQSRKWDKAAQYLHPETATEEGAGVISGFESLPLSVAGLLGGAYFRSAKIATGAISAVVGGQSYRKGIDEGMSNERAILFGTADAAIEYATEILPTGAILKSVGAKGKFGKNLADLLVTEIPGEQLATLGQDFNQWFSIDANKGKTFQSYLDERPAAAKQTLLATLVGAGTVTSAVSAAEFAAAKLGRELPRALPAEENARFLDALGRLSAASEVLKRDKGTFEDWVRTAAEDTEVTDVFVDAEQLAKIFDQSNLDPEQAFAITGLSPEQLQQAVQRGDTLSIPIEKYASEIASNPISSQLIPHLRVGPDDMSIEEAKVFLQGAKDEFAKDVEDTFAKSQQEDVLRTSHDAVHESVAAQLKGTGRFNSSVVDTYSGLTAAFYTTLGGKLGLTAEETASRYPLRIQSGEVAQPTFDQQRGKPTLNIGLNIPTGGTLTAEEIRAALADAGVGITGEAAQQSDSEQTLVVELDKPLSKEALFALSERLGQEGIAQSLGDGTGMLEGPQAALWGDFNPEFFFDLQGKRLSEAAARPAPEAQPLANLPKNSRGPFEPAHRAAQAYAAMTGMEYTPPRVYTPVDLSRAAHIALAYEEMANDPTNPDVRASYDAMIAETLAQWVVIKGTGLQVEFVQGEDPYGGNPFGAVDDVRQNNHIWVFNTEDGYGQGGITPGEEASNPMLAIVPNEEWSGRPVRANDIFRVVHDYFGHIKDGVGFRAAGEENAWRGHAAMYSPLARKAMTTETRGQNSWLNYGPYGEANRTARVEDTVFAEQKIGLLPDWVAEEGALDPDTFNQSAAVLQVLPLGFEPSGPGGRVLNRDLGEALTTRHMLKYGRALDPSDPADYEIAKQSLLEDYVDQLAQSDNGQAWYSDDIATAIEDTMLILPELALPVRRDIFLTAVALLSPQQGPVDNWSNAIDAMTGYSITGRFALQKPNFMNFGVASHATGLQLLQHLIETKGEIGALIWLNDEHTGREMEAIRRASGLFNNKADKYLPAEMNFTEKKLGAYMFGPKVGDFMLNSTGLDQSAVTVDLWMARTYNRVIGRLTDVNQKTAEQGGLADAMRGRGERDMVKRLVRDVAADAGIAPSAMQAALWYFEQRLYRKHGIQSGSTSFSDAARIALEKRGIEAPDRSAAGGRAQGGFDTEAVDPDEGVRVLDQSPIENPLTAFRRESFYPNRATRLEDGTVLAGDVPNWYPDRLAKIAEKIGAPKVEGVDKNDPRLDTGTPLWFTAPPIEADGTIRLDHWGPVGIATTDPTMWGAGNTLPPSERQRVGVALPRTYFGIASGLPGGYVIEFPTNTQYEARVDPVSLYDIGKDPDGLKKGDGVGPLEHRIKDAGYAGYWSNNEQLGLVATVFEPLPVKPASAQKITQDVGNYSSDTGYPLLQKTGQPRGQIAFAPDITKAASTITILRGADLSTFVHELGHFFFEVTNHVANQPDAPQQAIDDRDTMLRYIGATDVVEWQNMTPEARRHGHEIIARSFEAYLFEGKAPSVEMRGIFQRLRGWMMNVYRTITRLNVSLTDEVRSAFDRMLASEEQIRDTEADAAMAPQFAEKPEGMSDADWADYQQLGTEATAEASEALARRSLRDMQYAGRSVAREIKRLQAEMKERRDAMREEVDAEISAKPIYQAMTFLRKGTIGDSPAEEFHKLDTTIVREVLQLDAGMPLPDALKGMTSTKDGVNPEQVAELFGYSSADHLIKDLLFASPMKEAIEAETDARMRERYGEVAHPDQLDEAARAAVHNDVRGRFVATELAALQNAPGKKRVLDGAARRLASEMIARLRIRDLRPGQYENAERKAAKAAQKAGTANIDEAVRQKRNQLFQFHAAKAAHDAIEETRKARDYLSKFANKNTRAALDSSYLDQIDQLLERFELRQISNKEADRRKSIADWIKSQEDLGFEPTLDPDFLDEVGRKPWRDLTVEEMRELLDGIKNIEFLARRTKELLTAIDKANLEEAAGEVAQSIRTNALSSRPEIVGNKTWLEGVKNGVRDFFAMHRKMANLLYVFDGNALGGPAWERFMRGANSAGDTETQALRDAGSVLEPLFRSLGNTLRREYIPEIEHSLNLQDRLMIALNWGNATNRARVMDGDKWTPEQVEAILEPLTPAHWDFVEAVWAHINSYRQQIIDKEMRVSGVEPKMVEAEPFQVANPDGTLRLITGGYFPIKYDPDRSSKAEADTAADIAKQMQRGLYTRATTRRGHLKERVDTVANRPIRKDFGVIFEHNSQVIHDLAWHEYLIDANRLLRHGAVDSAIREHYGPETLRWMRKALEDMASGDVAAQNSFERGVNYVRTGATVAGLGWNLFTSLLQPMGLTQSAARIGTKWVGRGIGELIGNPAQMNEKVQWIYSVSPFMRARGDTMQREINEIRSTLAAKGPIRSGLDKVTSPEINDAISDSFFVMIAKAQLIADLPTWLGQYHKSLESGQSEERAIELANQSVIDSQGSGMIKDLAGVQKGSPLWKLWTNFYSYFSVTYNLLVDRTAEMRRIGPKDLPFFATDVLMLTVLPATLTAVMRALLKGDEPDEPEDWAALVAKENLSYMLGLVLGLREVSSAVTGDAGYRGPAGARIIGELSNLGKQVAQGEPDAAAFRAANNVAGVLLHYPAGQVDRTARGLYYLSKGEAGVMAPVVGPPKDAGQ